MYSQNLEEKYILDHFKDQASGTFLSVGENDGVTLSNVRALAELGWCGCMIEPAPKAFARLKKLYESEKKGCFYLYNCAIGNHNGNAVLHDSGELLRKGDTSLVSTLVVDEKKRFEKVLTYEEVEVKVYRWKTFYNRLTIKKFDCVSIDAEGFDIDILKQMDLNALEVKCLCIEFNGKQDLKVEIDKIMQGFNIIYTSGENLIYGR